MNEPTATNDCRLSGGEIPAAEVAAYQALRAKLKAQPDVYEVIHLVRRADGMWNYLIQTPLAWVFPKYVIGVTNEHLEGGELLMQTGARWSADAHWDRIHHGKDGEA